MSEYRVDLEAFSGPLDLLLYLIKQEEIEITDIPISYICDRFLEELETMERLDLEAAGDFLVLASTLMLIKSRMIIRPAEEADEDEEWEDPRLELVEQLLEYRRCREAAGLLDDRRSAMARRFTRGVPDLDRLLPPDDAEKEISLGDVSIAALFEAFERIVRETALGRPATFIYDETPIPVYAAALVERLRAGPVRFLEALGGPDAPRDRIVGTFIALLELIKQGRAAARQDGPFGEIHVELRE